MIGSTCVVENDEVDGGGSVRTVVDGVETDITGRTFSLEMLVLGLKDLAQFLHVVVGHHVLYLHPCNVVEQHSKEVDHHSYC